MVPLSLANFAVPYSSSFILVTCVILFLSPRAALVKTLVEAMLSRRCLHAASHFSPNLKSVPVYFFKEIFIEIVFESKKNVFFMLRPTKKMCFLY